MLKQDLRGFRIHIPPAGHHLMSASSQGGAHEIVAIG
jgi:hypothetical protein